MALKGPNYDSHKMKPVVKRPLENKTFYLDLKMYPGEATLSKNLKFLGGKVEPLFSRSVSCVVTNRESARNAPNDRPFKVPSKPQNWSPLTPITNTACHSPLFFNESSVHYMDSPPYTNSPTTDQNAAPLCRGMAMVKKAILKKQGQGTTDLIENCRLWKVKVIHVNDVLPKVEKLKSIYGAHFAAEKKRTQNGERKLKPPFLKVEELKRVRTWYREFPSSTFDNKLADKVKELYNHFKKSGNIQVAFKSDQVEFSKNKCYTKSLISQSPVPTQSVSKSVSKFSDTAKVSTAVSFCNKKRKISEHAAVASKKQKTSQGRKKKFYCEICKEYYVHLDKHLASEKHRIFMSDPMNFLEIQNIIQSLPNKEDFLLSRLPLSSDIGQTSGETSLFSSQVLNSANNLQAYPNTCSLLENKVTSEQFNLKEVASAGNDDLDTEPYIVFDEHYVSPSCTSPDYAYLPYLEDSIDKLGSDSLEDTNISNTPLNLSIDRERNIVNQSIYPESLKIRESTVETLIEDISATENMATVSIKRKFEEELLNCALPVKKPFTLHEITNWTNRDEKDETSQQVPLIKHNSGINIQDSPFPTLMLCQLQETEAALQKCDECCALDLSTTSIVSEEKFDSRSKDSSNFTCQYVSFDYENIPKKYLCYESTVVADIENANQPKTLKKSEHNVDLSTDIACDPIPNDNKNQAVFSSNVLEVVTIGTYCGSKAPCILNSSDSDARLQNINHWLNTCEQVSSENPNILSQPHNNKNTYESNAVTIEELEDTEELNNFHNNEQTAPTQNTNHLTFSSEHKKIQQEATRSEFEGENNAVDIGTFGNSGCLDTSNILPGCKIDNTPNTSSPINVSDQLLHNECQNHQDKVNSTSDMKDNDFVQLCEEVTRSFNDIEYDLSSSEVSCYELVEEVNSISDCDWDPVQKNLDQLCKSDNEDSNPSTCC